MGFTSEPPVGSEYDYNNNFNVLNWIRADIDKRIGYNDGVEWIVEFLRGALGVSDYDTRITNLGEQRLLLYVNDQGYSSVDEFFDDIKDRSDGYVTGMQYKPYVDILLFELSLAKRRDNFCRCYELGYNIPRDVLKEV